MGTRGSFAIDEADHSPTSNAEVKECVDIYIHSPNSWHVAQLKKSTGTTLSIK
jgi:hypothetical protein